MTRIPLASIVFDAGTQVREAISEPLVADYAECMTEGDRFPPIVLFHDGNRYYLADGFHRALASQRLAFVDIEADVRPGTQIDALWFALGANRKNGKRLTSSDLRYAILLAFKTWPDRSANQVAEQTGCTHAYVDRIRSEVATSSNLPDHVTGKDGKSYPAAGPARTGAARKDRLERIRQMAAEGHSSRQIAAALGIGEDGLRVRLRRESIDVPADRVTHHTKRHDANRIVEQVVMDASNLTECVTLIDFSALDADRLGEWADTLIAARRALDGFIKRLVKERQKHGEAA